MLAKGTVLMITSDPLQRLALMIWMVHMKMLINAVNKWEDKQRHEKVVDEKPSGSCKKNRTDISGVV